MVAQEVFVRRDGFRVSLAKKFTDAASQYRSEIRVHWPEREVISDGKNILGVMALNVREGDLIAIAGEGEDEVQAVTALVRLLAEA